jgi:hypothetical protein
LLNLETFDFGVVFVELFGDHVAGEIISGLHEGINSSACEVYVLIMTRYALLKDFEAGLDLLAEVLLRGDILSLS